MSAAAAAGGHEEGHEGAPEWLISFADNVTLMMGFFVIMLAFNMGPKGGSDAEATQEGQATSAATPDLLDMAISIRTAFNNPVDPSSTDPEDQVLIQRLLQRRGDVPIDADGPRGQEDRVQSLRKSPFEAVCGKIPFETGSVVLSDAAQETLLNVIQHIRGLNMIIDLRGHVSALEAYELRDRGMKLAFDRAATVADVLCDHGVHRAQLRLIACGDGDRVQITAYTPQEHARNQRVELVLTEDLAPPYAISPGEWNRKPGEAPAGSPAKTQGKDNAAEE